LSPIVRRHVVGMSLNVADSRADFEEENGTSDERPALLSLCQ